MKVGARLGPYEILAAIGAGGMGEVYRARDTQLKRDVALKVLPADVATDPDRLARFQREAELLAALNHPHIAQIYGLAEADGVRALVMELVEGETLAARIARGPVPLDEALPLAHQVAEALEFAHEHGIIHRDLKPANITLTPDGAVKVLDFGLAKALEVRPATGDPSESPTMTSPAMTQAGIILGTAAYMSPEQARGAAVDKRADIWAFGVILYELLTGRRLFEGETVSDTLAAVLRADVDWKALPASTPLNVRHVLRRCLVRQPKERLHDIGDARLDLEEATSRTGEILPAQEHARSKPSRMPWAFGVLMTFVAAALALYMGLRPESPRPPTRRFAISLPEPLILDNYPSMAVSPDGMQLVYFAGRFPWRLYGLRLDEPEFKAIPGAEGGYNPFFSPDGKWIGFFAEGRLKKLPLAGGPTVALTGILSLFAGGGMWGADDRILFQTTWSGSVARVPAAGGTPEILLTPDTRKNERGLLWPQYLSADGFVLFTTFAGNVVSMNDAKIAVGRLGSRPEKRILTGGTYGRYLPTGHLVYGYDGKLMAVPLDLAGLRLAGSPIPVLEGIMMDPRTGAAEFAVSSTGDLFYVPGAMIKGRDTLVLVDREGKTEQIDFSTGEYESHIITSPTFSQDGKRLAFCMHKANDDIHIYDLVSKTLTRATFEGGDERSPVWTVDGARLAYTSEPGPVFQIFMKEVDGSSAPKPFFGNVNPRYPRSFSGDGRVLAFEENNPETGWDIWTGRVEGGAQAKPFLNTQYSESFPTFSPDGQWIAYQSDESGGQMQVFVVKHPDGSGKRQISQNGGTEPLWDPSGKELYYLSGGRLMAVETTFTPSPRFATPRVRLTVDDLFVSGGTPRRSYAVAPGGGRFAFVRKTSMPAVAQVRVVVNWFGELKAKVPTGR